MDSFATTGVVFWACPIVALVASCPEGLKAENRGIEELLDEMGRNTEKPVRPIDSYRLKQQDTIRTRPRAVLKRSHSYRTKRDSRRMSATKGSNVDLAAVLHQRDQDFLVPDSADCFNSLQEESLQGKLYIRICPNMSALNQIHYWSNMIQYLQRAHLTWKSEVMIAPRYPLRLPLRWRSKVFRGHSELSRKSVSQVSPPSSCSAWVSLPLWPGIGRWFWSH